MRAGFKSALSLSEFAWEKKDGDRGEFSYCFYTEKRGEIKRIENDGECRLSQSYIILLTDKHDSLVGEENKFNNIRNIHDKLVFVNSCLFTGPVS